jgi:xylan 1,4-beta-xylosidase
MKILIGLFLSVMAAASQAADQRFTWTNPLNVELRDPQIIIADGRYYLTGTTAPYFEQLGPSPGVRLWSSIDLLNWKDDGIIVAPSKDNWYRLRFWAPEIYRHTDGRFYCTFNCPDGPDARSTQSVGLAVADHVTGPYTVLTNNKPLTSGNDADLFRDTDGKIYLFRSGITAIEVDLTNAKTIGNSFDVIPKGPPGAWDGTSIGAPAVGLEGPCVYKIDGTYYLFYSSWGRGYEVGYATAKTVHGPRTKYAHNPIYGAQGKAWARRYKHEYTQAPGIPYQQVGHNSLFVGPDGRYWICAHAYRNNEPVLHPHLVIDPLNFADGTFTATPVSYTKQSVQIKSGDYPPTNTIIGRK